MGKYTEALDPNNPHLGGNYIEMNQHTHCPKAWQYVINKHNIKSVLDIGSGRGHAAKWFHEQGLKSVAIEGMEEIADLRCIRRNVSIYLKKLLAQMSIW